MAPFYGWGPTVTRLQNHNKETVYFLHLLNSLCLLFIIFTNTSTYQKEIFISLIYILSIVDVV